MNETKHTPTPWIIFSDRGNAIAIMPAGRPGDVCKMTTDRLQAEVNANAQFIVTAVNAHDDLLALLLKFKTAAFPDGTYCWCAMPPRISTVAHSTRCEQARAALKAEVA